MAAAWEQLGEIQRINQMRRQAQLGRAVNGVYHAKHFSRFSEETLLKVVGSAQSRVVSSRPQNGDNDDAVAKDFSIGHPGQSHLRAVAPDDEPAQCNQHPLPDRRRAAHRHRGQAEHDIHCQLCKKEAGLVTLNLVSDPSGVPADKGSRSLREATNALNRAAARLI